MKDKIIIDYSQNVYEELEQLQQRIDKAIEYIEENTTENDEDYRFCMELLEILKGEPNNE